MPEPDIEVAVDYALAQSGKPYHAYGARFGPDYYDCSGLVVASLRAAGIIVPPDVRNTSHLYLWAKRVGGLVSVAQGVATRGAIMIKGKWYGVGPLGHASFSLGDENGDGVSDGREMAAHGTRSGIHANVMDQDYYQDAFIIPDVNYHLDPPVDLVAVKRLLDWRDSVTALPLAIGDRGPRVVILNEQLARKGLVKSGGNAYGRLTRIGVHHLKVAKRLENTDGTHFGGPAANALLGL